MLFGIYYVASASIVYTKNHFITFLEEMLDGVINKVEPMT